MIKNFFLIRPVAPEISKSKQSLKLYGFIYVIYVYLFANSVDSIYNLSLTVIGYLELFTAARWRRSIQELYFFNEPVVVKHSIPTYFSTEHILWSSYFL